MLAKSLLKMVSALNSKDIKELRSLYTEKGKTSRGYDIATLISSCDTEELKSMLTPDEFECLEVSSAVAEQVFSQLEQALDSLKWTIETLLTRVSGIDLPYLQKALFKLNELRTALRED